jgi:hypothetical protein
LTGEFDVSIHQQKMYMDMACLDRDLASNLHVIHQAAGIPATKRFRTTAWEAAWSGKRFPGRQTKQVDNGLVGAWLLVLCIESCLCELWIKKCPVIYTGRSSDGHPPKLV